jgi:hypothetical protein
LPNSIITQLDFTLFSKQPEALTYHEGEDDEEDEEEGELVVVGSEVGALVKQEVWTGDDSIPRQAAYFQILAY